MKKHKIILRELKSRRDSNHKHCEQNSSKPTDFMLGSNKELDHLINFVEKMTE